MSLISSKLIEKPRKQWYCDDCRQVIQGAYQRLYGAGMEGDPPYVLRMCLGCYSRCTDRPVKRTT